MHALGQVGAYVGTCCLVTVSRAQEKPGEPLSALELRGQAKTQEDPHKGGAQVRDAARLTSVT